MVSLGMVLGLGVLGLGVVLGLRLGMHMVLRLVLGVRLVLAMRSVLAMMPALVVQSVMHAMVSASVVLVPMQRSHIHNRTGLHLRRTHQHHYTQDNSRIKQQIKSDAGSCVAAK